MKYESFDWIRPENIDPRLKKEYLVKVVAKTPSKTDHTKDITIPIEDRVVRIYPKEELQAAARSLAMRHIDFNHEMARIIPSALVLDAEWFDERVEALLYIPDEKIINQLKEGKFDGFSVEEMVRNEEKSPEGMIQRGVAYTGLAIVTPPYRSGDPNANVAEFFETSGVKFEALSEVKVVTEHKVLTEAVVEPPKPQPTLEEKVKSLEEGYKVVTKKLEEFDKNKAVEIDKAKKEARKEIADKVRSKLPDGFVKQKYTMGAKRTIDEIQKVLYEEEKK